MKENKNPKELSKAQTKALRYAAVEMASSQREESKQLYESMSEEDKNEYEQIMKLFKNKDMPNDTREYLTQKLIEITKKYTKI